MGKYILVKLNAFLKNINVNILFINIQLFEIHILNFSFFPM